MLRKGILIMVALLAFGVALTAAPQPAAAQTNPVWQAAYYNNPTLAGSPVFRRVDSAIAFNWGSGSPGDDIDDDRFSVRWTADVNLPAGTYRFSALADDNVSVIIDFSNRIIDTWGQGRVGQTVTADVVLSGGTHHIQVDYGEITSDAYVFVSFANLASSPSGPVFAPPSTSPVTGGSWTALYYDNANLSGDPVLIQSEDDPSNDWGTASPAAVVPNDNWSARWTSSQSLTGGRYRVSVRADDGVRIYVNGVLVINEWHGHLPNTYIADVTLPTGLSTFQIEFFDASSFAFLFYQLVQLNPSVPAAATQTPAAISPTGSTATVTARELNVRTVPDPVAGRIITRVTRGQIYPVLGRNFDTSWVQIDINGTVGWVNASFVQLTNAASIPLASGSTASTPPPIQQQPQAQAVPGDTGYTVTTVPSAVSLRSGAGTTFPVIGTMPRNATARVLGRDSAGFWWQVNYNGQIGWVYSQIAIIQSGADLSRIPITG
jgi:uncharacterized protein YraI